MSSKEYTALEKRSFLLGRGISKSLSLPIQNAAFKELGIKARYELLDLGGEDLDGFVQSLRKATNVLGFNVTKPFKEEIIQFLSSLDPRSKSIGAVNTVKVTQDGMEGYNTDYDGIVSSLEEIGALRVSREEEKTALILGAGGVARACIAVLLDNGYTRVVILNRTVRRAEMISKEFSSRVGDSNIRFDLLTGENIAKYIGRDCSLVINAITESSSNYFPTELDFTNASKTKVFDLGYGEETLLLKVAKRRGLETIDGLLMLVVQAAKSFEIWTERNAPLKAMMSAAKSSREK